MFNETKLYGRILLTPHYFKKVILAAGGTQPKRTFPGNAWPVCLAGQALLDNPDIVSLVITGSLVASLPLSILFFYYKVTGGAGAASGAVN